MAQEQDAGGVIQSSASTGKAVEPDPRNSLKHLLASDPGERDRNSDSKAQNKDWASENQAVKADHGYPSKTSSHVVREEASAPEEEESPHYTSTTTTTRRNANGSVSSVYSGNKIRHLKKADGEPLWREDIQLMFLEKVFEDKKPVFTSPSDHTQGHTFADIYIETMARSSKSSKILKDKLMTDRPAAINMAMVCLLVNVGRMNTTLNFFPEMRAALRTYHSIPSLQAKHNGQASKQLQDAPRLKSILKGAMEDQDQPHTVNEIMNRPKPRTNPVNLIFVLSQYAPKISEVHFFAPRDFFDLVMRSTLSSSSRAIAFLWLMWWYLESDFSDADSQNNPYGAGLKGPGSLGRAIKVPAFETLTPEQAEAENVDTKEEIAYGKAKKAERDAILATGIPPSAGAPKRLHKTLGSEHHGNFRFKSPILVDDDRGTEGADRSSIAAEGDSEYQSQSPARERSSLSRKKSSLGIQQSDLRINRLLNEDNMANNQSSNQGTYVHTPRKGIGRGNWPRPRKPKGSLGGRGSASRLQSNNSFQGSPEQQFQSSSVISGHSPPHRNNSYASTSFQVQQTEHNTTKESGQATTGRRPRMLTAHQQALELSRRKRVAYLLDLKKRSVSEQSKKEKRKRGSVVNAWIKSSQLPSGWDSEEDEGKRIGGLSEPTYESLGDVGSSAKKNSAMLSRWARWIENDRKIPLSTTYVRDIARRSNINGWQQTNGTANVRDSAQTSKTRNYHQGSRSQQDDSDIEMADHRSSWHVDNLQNGTSTSRNGGESKTIRQQSTAASEADEADEIAGELMADGEGDENGSESGSDQDTVDEADEDTIMVEA